MTYLKSLLGTMRIPFVILTPACVTLGLGTALWEQEQINWLYFVLAMTGAVSAHIAVNVFNEYFDFKSGLDAMTQRTPFSGGSGTLPERPEMVVGTLVAAVIAFLITTGIGIFFLYVRGMFLLPLGLVGLLTIVAYTSWVAKNPVLCLFAPGLGFGPLMVVGTHMVLTGTFSWTALVASLVPFFLVNDLLLLNQFPDVEADRAVGRRHLPIVIGRTRSSRVYVAFLLLPFLIIGAAVTTGLFPIWSLIGLLPLVLAIPMSIGISKNAEDTEKLLPFMGQNVIVNLATPVLVSIGLIIS